MEVLGRDYEFIQNFDKKSRGKTSIVKSIKKNQTEIRKTLMRPTFLANQYV